MTLLLALHAPSLGLATVCVAAVLGMLLLCTWFQERSHRALLWWGASYLLAAIGTSLLTLRDSIANFLSIDIANALVLLAAAGAWMGTRCFEGRSTPLPWLVAPALVWMLIVQLPFAAADIHVRVLVLSLEMAILLSLSAYELWRGRQEMLVSRWPAIIIFSFYAATMLARIPFTYVIFPPPSHQPFQSSWFGILAMGTLIYIVAVAFVLLAMTKERTELWHRTAALVDSLTGLPNRRAFLHEGSAHLAEAEHAHRPAAVLVFDLDEFKQINDRHGHPIGDKVLQAFAEAVRTQVRARDVIGRIGGEEFAAVLLDCSPSQALDVAERIRWSFAETARTMEARRVNATVSIGVATLGDERQLGELLAAADRAVYRAKSDGRNCVRASEIASDLTPSEAPPASTEDVSLAA